MLQTKPLVRFFDRLGVSVPKLKAITHNSGERYDRVWEEGAKLSPFLTFYENDEANPETEVALARDPFHLFICIKAGCATCRADQRVSDSVEIMISPAPTYQSYYRLSSLLPGSSKGVLAKLGSGCIELERSDIDIDIDIDIDTTERDGHCFMNITIPFHRLNVRQVQPGEEWGFNIIRHSIGSFPANSWTPIRHSYFIDKESSYELTAVVAEEGRLGTISFGDARDQAYLRISEFAYVGFTDKEIVVHADDALVHPAKVFLDWKTPSGKSYPIDPIHVAKEDGAYRIVFTHPEPIENGLYRLDLTLRGEQGDVAAVTSIRFDRIDLIEAGCESLRTGDQSDSGEAHGIDEKTTVMPRPASEDVRRLIELIPDKTGMEFAGLPDRPDLWPYLLYDWNELNPNQINSTKSSSVYPNEQYPENRKFCIRNPEGEWVEYPYHEDGNGKKYFLSAHAWLRSRDYVLGETDKLASDDPLGAARILFHFAKMYRGYFPVYDYPWIGYPMEKQAGPPYPYWGGLWNRWFYMDLYQLRHLFHAFGKVDRTNAFQLLDEETGEDVRALIVNQMFLPSVSFVKTYPIMNTNMDFANWIGLAYLGRALNDPRYIHEVVEHLQAFCKSQFLFDGFWKEVTLSYHRQIMVGIKKVTDVLLGWTDPEGYVSPYTGGSIRELDMETELPFLQKAQRLLDDLVYPNGHVLPITDTWAYDLSEQPNPNTGSFLLPAAGIGKMSRGTGLNQMQVYMTFVPKYGHNHLDPLNLVLYAHGQELLPDTGYTHTKYRYSTVSTIGHNTVTVNGADMSVSDGLHGGNIEVFAPAHRTFQVIRTCQKNAYPVMERYNREIWTIGLSDDDEREGYVLDIFRVGGGNRHEYCLHGDANCESSFQTDLTMRPYGPTLLPEGVDYAEAALESDQGYAGEHYAAYMYVKDVSRAVVENGAYSLTLATSDGHVDRAKLRIIGDAGDGRCELFIGKFPSIKGTRMFKQDTNDVAEQHFAPQMIVRREGERLQSHYVTLMEPIEAGGQSRISKMSVQRFDEGQQGEVVIFVQHGTTTDIILSTDGSSGRQLLFEDIVLNGKMGLIRMEGKQVTKMMLLGGSSLRKGDRTLRSTGQLKGTICAVLRRQDNHECNAFVVDIPVPPDLKGSYMIVTHPDGKTHGFRIHGIRQEQRGTLLDLNDMDPGFTLRDDGMSELNFFPHTKWHGTHTFIIDPVVVSD